ncbi:MAG: hypothetical protein ACREDK_02530 [Thermoplasmata archaeon]
MAWREVFDLVRAPYSELSFQAIYALRMGNQPPPDRAGSLVETARTRVLQSKLLVSLVLAGVSSVIVLALDPRVEFQLGDGLPPGLYAGGVLTLVLVLQIVLLWWAGVQVLPTFLGSSILPTLETLPVAPRTLDRVALVLLLRLFDLPALTCLVLTPIATAAALGSIYAGLATIPAEVAVVVLAISLALLTGRFFVTRVQGARGGSAQTFVRWGYLILWAVPAFTMYGFMILILPFFHALAALAVSGATASIALVLSTFPFSLALLPSVAAGGTFSAGFDPSAGLVASALYLVLLLGAGGWLIGAPRRLARAVPQSTGTPHAGDTTLHPTFTPWAILVKDLRTASRTPGFAFLILLPLLDAIAIGLFTYASNTAGADAFSLGAGAVVTAGLLATFFGPAFFAIEVMGYSYARTLPLRQRTLLAGKVALMVAIYLVASGVVLGITLLKVRDPGVFLLFIAAELPAILAAGLLELGLLFMVARLRGLPIVNLYTGAWWLTGVAVPGLLVAALPIAVYWGSGATGAPTSLVVMAAVALLELVACLGFAMGPATREGA